MKPYLTPTSQVREYRISFLMNDNISGSGTLQGVNNDVPGYVQYQDPR